MIFLLSIYIVQTNTRKHCNVVKYLIICFPINHNQTTTYIWAEEVGCSVCEMTSLQLCGAIVVVALSIHNVISGSLTATALIQKLRFERYAYHHDNLFVKKKHSTYVWIIQCWAGIDRNLRHAG